VLQQIKAGKTVVMLDGGDPCVYGRSLYWLLKGFDDRYFEIIPVMSAFNSEQNPLFLCLAIISADISAELLP